MTMCKLPPFVNLHCHSTASSVVSIDGMSMVDDIAEHAKKTGANAIALTDHGGVFNNVNFWEACKKRSVKPIMGCEYYIVPNVQTQKDDGVGRGKSNHITVLAQNKIGWTNMVRLASRSNHPDHFYHEPRIDFNDLASHKEGLIILSGCPKGVIANAYLAGDLAKAESLARQFIQAFGDRFYFEVQDAGIRDENLNQLELNEFIRSLAKKYDRPTVFTLDSHFPAQGDSCAHQYLLGINMGRNIEDIRSGAYAGSDQYYLKTTKECMKMDCREEEILEAKRIGDLVEEYDIGIGGKNLPHLELPEGKTAIEVLREKALEGWYKYGVDQYPNKDVYAARMKHELADIEQVGMAEYFLIIEDIVTWARGQGIMIGCGRGSAGGSLTLFLLGITGRNLDPIKWGLVWERFYNVGRESSFPDVDLDFEKERREEVIQYIGDKFGHERVAQLITFGTMGARSVLKNVMRTYGVPYEEAKMITGLIPEKDDDHGTKISIDDSIAKQPKLAEYETKYPEVFAIARKLEGKWVSYGKHAAAVIINNEPFESGNLPLVRERKEKSLICGWDMDVIDKMGFLKIDALGLNELDIHKRAFELIEERHGIKYDPEDLPLDEKGAFEVLSQGRTEGIFQLGKALGRNWCKRLKPETVEDISDICALIRPACLDVGMTAKYERIKNGKEEESYIHDDLKPILGPTRSTYIYQEQALQMCAMIGMTLQEADIVRKAIGKKKPELLAKQEEKFMKLARERYPDEIATQLWDYIKEGAGYGFNKSHSLAYALTAYTGAFLKAKYPIEFYCAHMAKCKNLGDKQKAFEKISEFINDAKMDEINVTPPSLKAGNTDFAILDDNSIAFGLSHIKGVGAAALRLIKKCAGADNFYEFMKLCFKHRINKKAVQAMILSGAADCFGMPRSQMELEYLTIADLPGKQKDYVVAEIDEDEGLLPLIERMGDEETVDERKAEKTFVPNKPQRQKLRDLYSQLHAQSSFSDDIEKNLEYEEEFLGTSLSGTFEDVYGYLPAAKNTCREVRDMADGSRLHLCVRLDEVREHITRETRKKMAFLTVSDSTNMLRDVVVFPKTYDQYEHSIKEGNIVQMWGWYEKGVKIYKIKTISVPKCTTY